MTPDQRRYHAAIRDQLRALADELARQARPEEPPARAQARRDLIAYYRRAVEQETQILEGATC